MTTSGSSLGDMVPGCQLWCMSMMHSSALAAGSPHGCAEGTCCQGGSPAMSASVCDLSRRNALNSPPLPLREARTLVLGDSGVCQHRMLVRN